MKFYDYRDSISAIRKLYNISASAEEIYECALSTNDIMAFRHVMFEMNWAKAKKPYYDVYPSIIKMLCKINLDFPGDMIPKPNGISHLVLRLPENQDYLVDDESQIKIIFLSFQKCAREVGSKETSPALVIGVDIGEIEPISGMQVYTIKAFPIDERPVEITINELLDHPSLHIGKRVNNELLEKCVRLAIGVCMIGNDSELLEPEVLSKDRQKYQNATEETKKKLIDKAIRRGKYGFSLGKSIEKIPHIRRPHMALVWTGKGRKIPKIVMRKGSIIHRDKIKNIPTGYKS